MNAVWKYRILRRLGRVVTRLAALATFEKMPPFVSSSAVVLDGHRVLAVVDPIRREPVLPGGHASWRESPEDACVRETREETGLSVSVQRLVGVFSGEAVTGEPGVVRVIYCADAVGGALESSGEGEARWMTVEEFIRGSRRDGPILQQALACAKGHLSQ